MRFVSLFLIAALLIALPVAAAHKVWVCPMSEHAQEFDKPGTCPLCGMTLVEKDKQLKVAVLVYDDAEEIDFAGPIEIFGEAGARVFTVGPTTDVTKSVFALHLKPEFDLEHAPDADIILVPGGGTHGMQKNEKVLQWLRDRSKSAKYVLSVCNGAFIVASAGLLDGLKATTTAGRIDELAAYAPKTTVVRERLVDNGKIITTTGLSAGIDGALHILEREFGHDRAAMVARGMEYRWRPDDPWTHSKDAEMRMPDVHLPDGAQWEKLSSNGDTRQWEVRGRLIVARDLDELLDDASKQLVAKGWTERERANGKRAWAKTDRDGEWLASISSVVEAPSTYLETLSIRKLQ
jgi:putative intracellular protease/amidase